MTTDNAQEPKPAYVTYTTFDNFINGLKETGIPNRIDKSVLGTMSGTVQSFMMGALRFLDLVTESGAPTQAMKDLVSGDRKKALSDMVHHSYDFLFSGFNLKAATLQEVEEKFREKQLSGDTIRKAISFFTLACDAAGIAYSPHLKSKKGTRGNGGTRRQRKPKGDAGETAPPLDNSQTKQDPAYHPPQVLPLAKDRKVTVVAPKDMTKQEIARMARWMEVTFQIDWNDDGSK